MDGWIGGLCLCLWLWGGLWGLGAWVGSWVGSRPGPTFAEKLGYAAGKVPCRITFHPFVFHLPGELTRISEAFGRAHSR